MRRDFFLETDDGWPKFDTASITALTEISDVFLGRVIGKGVSRTVFACKFDRAVVIKIGDEYDPSNAVEVSTYNKYRDDPNVGKWLAPVYGYSKNFRVIVQAATMPMERLPKKLPEFFTDLKVQNFGLFEGRVVCHDYGQGLKILPDNTNMVPVSWWDGLTTKEYNNK